MARTRKYKVVVSKRRKRESDLSLYRWVSLFLPIRQPSTSSKHNILQIRCTLLPIYSEKEHVLGWQDTVKFDGGVPEWYRESNLIPKFDRSVPWACDEFGWLLGQPCCTDDDFIVRLGLVKPFVIRFFIIPWTLNKVSWFSSPKCGPFLVHHQNKDNSCLDWKSARTHIRQQGDPWRSSYALVGIYLQCNHMSESCCPAIEGKQSDCLETSPLRALSACLKIKVFFDKKFLFNLDRRYIWNQLEYPIPRPESTCHQKLWQIFCCHQ